MIQDKSQADKEMTTVDGVANYKELSEVERGFHTVKDPLATRPIWHHVDRRVRAHIFVAALAFLLDRMLERALRDAGSELSSSAAWSALETIRHVRLLGTGKPRHGVNPGARTSRHVPRALHRSSTTTPPPPTLSEPYVLVREAP